MKIGKHRKNISYTKTISIYLWICIVGLIISIPIFNEIINKHDLEVSNNMCGIIAEKMNNSITYINEAVTGRAEILSSSKIEDWNAVYESLIENLNENGCKSIGLIDKEGNVYGKENEDKEFEKWGIKDQVKNSQTIFFSAPYRHGGSGKMVITIFSPIYQEGERAGELFMTFDLEVIQRMADSEILQDSMEIYLMNPFSNNYIKCFSADKATVGSWNNTRLLYDQIETVKGKTYSEWIKEMRRGKDGSVVFFKQDDVLYTQVFVTIDVMQDWSVVVRVPNDAMSYNLRVFHMGIIVFIVVLILMLFIFFVLSYRSADIERKKLEYLSVHDPLTKLANRRAFEDIYNEYLAENTKKEKKGVLIFFDIDYFKQVNDGFGHAMGDRVLKEFAYIANEIFGYCGTVSRFGGDEFVLLINELESRKVLEYHMKEFQRRLRQLDFLKNDAGEVFMIHFSAGIVEVKNSGNALEEIERKADQALYDVKKRGRDGYAWYEGE